jgi:sugar phosphate permease
MAGVRVNAGWGLDSDKSNEPGNLGMEIPGELDLATFRRRRALNWLVLGFTYSAMYLGRYNLALVNPILSKSYGWDKTQVGSIISPALLAYGIFAIFNGPISDRIGGKKVDSYWRTWLCFL